MMTADLGPRSPLGAARLAELNLFTTVAHHAELFPAWMRFARKLLVEGSLPATDRELVILRVAHRLGSAYEWAHHARIATAVGIDPAAVAQGRGWDERSRLLLSAVDELQERATITDPTWAGLRRHLTTPQLIELPVLAGHYVLLAYTLNALNIPPDPHPLPVDQGSLEHLLAGKCSKLP